MRLFAKFAAVVLATCSVATAASAASYNMSYVATNAAHGSFTGTGDVGATLLVGDSVTITLTAPAGEDFVTGGGFQFNWQVQQGGMNINEDVSWAYTLNNAVVASGFLANQGVCCADLRLPVYSSPNATWDKLVYTATIDSEGGPATLLNAFNLQQDGTFTAAVPEPAQSALFAIGLLGVAIARRRRSR